MMEKFVERVCSWLAERLPQRLITRGDNSPYLLRNYFFRHSEKWPSKPGLYLHCFLASDDEDELHNHPFKWSVSLILTGGYFEDRVLWWHKKRNLDLKFNPLAYDDSWCCSRNPGGPPVGIERKEFKPFRLNFIRAGDFHRVDLRGKRAWTLFLAGPRTQDWGFLDPKTGEFLQWEEHVRKRGETTQSDRYRHGVSAT